MKKDDFEGWALYGMTSAIAREWSGDQVNQGNVMRTEAIIKQKISTALRYDHFDLINESHLHAGPRTDSHFKLIIVSKEFAGQTKIKRHQLVYRILSDELSTSIHALSLHLFTPEEWLVREVPESPLCAGQNNPS